MRIDYYGISFMRRILSVFLLFLLSFSVCLRAADLGEEYLGAFQDFQTGEKLEREGHFSEALAKYQNAESTLRSVMQKDAEWQPEVVEYRLRKTLEAVTRVRESAAREGEVVDYPEGALPVQDGGGAGLPAVSPRVPSTERRPETLHSESLGGGSLGASSTRQRRQLQELRDQNTKLQEQIAQMRAELKAAYLEVDKRKIDVVELRSLNRQLKDQLDNLKKDSGSVDETLKKKDKEFVELLETLKKTQAERDVLSEENEEMYKRLEDAAKYVESSEELKKSLTKERDEALTRIKKAKDSKDEMDQLLKDNKALAAKLEEVAERAKKAEAERDTQSKSTQKEVDALKKEKEALVKKSEALGEQLAAVKKQVEETSHAAAESLADLEKVRKENATLHDKLTASESHVQTLETERNALLKKLETVKADSEKLQKAAEQKEETTQRLVELEKRSEEATKKESVSPEEIQKLRSELNSARDQLMAAQTLAEKKEGRISDLEKQLDQVSGELASLKLNPVRSEEDDRVRRENEVLRGLVVRQLRKASEIEKDRSTIQDELRRLQIKSDKLDATLSRLEADKFEMTDEEKSLFKEPVVLLSESPDGDQISVEMAMSKPGGNDATKEKEVSKEKEEGNSSESAHPDAEADAEGENGVRPLPAEFKEEIQQAKHFYDKGDFVEAEEIYQKILDKIPENYFALTNLAVTQFHLDRLSAAEVALRKAIALSPSTPDAYTILGIVNYRQGRFDDAVTILQRAIDLNDKDFAAHNYLGITLSEKGDAQNAIKELERATELNPDYADAHFNLAVIYATATPPQKEKAKEQYSKAMELGAPPDSSLERLIQ